MDHKTAFGKLDKIVYYDRAKENAGIRMPRNDPYFDYARLPKGGEIFLETEQERYQLSIINPMRGHTVIQGSELFKEPTPAIFDGSVCGDLLINNRGQIGMRFKVTCLEGEVVINELIKSFDVFYETGETFILGRS